MVSIIIPTYNRADVLGRAVDSVLRQTCTEWELLIVDDASTDGTEAVVGAMQDTRIRYIPLPENMGAAHARNVGIQAAGYDYIAFLDSDDEWLPDKLEEQMRVMTAAGNRLGMVYCRMGGLRRDGDGRFMCPSAEYARAELEGDMFASLLLQNVIGLPTMLVRRECLAQTGGFKEALHCLEDWELVLRIAKRYAIGFVDRVLVEVHKSADSVSVNAGWHLVARCYMVSLYRDEIAQLGALEEMQEEILAIAGKAGLYEEIRELLTRNIEL